MEEADYIKGKKLTDINDVTQNQALLQGLAQKLAPQEQYQTQSSRATANIQKADVLKQQLKDLETQKADVTAKLAHVNSLQTDWQTVESEMYRVIQPFSLPALQTRLENATKESNAVSEGLSDSFLERQDADVVEFIRSYQTERKQYHLRREWLDRWKEERVSSRLN